VQLKCQSKRRDEFFVVSILTRPEGRVQLVKLNSNQTVSLVSILTRPEGRVQLVKLNSNQTVSLVSILTRPEGRVQQCSGA